ncbi:MAG: filamentous hemagglutinin N-terminal domain-containing protein [Proteobacteria bacterium]|nr:filamentous hemagglutinin N-terminal domain-containing protein [Pseudomonadota bacterium]
MTPVSEGGYHRLLRTLVFVSPLVAASPVLAQAVVANGTTATTVSTGAGGRINVNIAPVTSNGTSINRYSAFSVPTTGVDLNNRTAAANTIINEVTGSSRTLLNGPLEVLGPRAHVVLVNPNGVTVDGGSFINTGGVAISAGSIRYSGGNAVLNTGASDITVSGRGLEGDMTSLQLVASRLRIDGPVINRNASPNADIAVVAGRQDVTLDSSLVAGSTSRPWASRTELGGASSEILVDVTGRGTLEASKVSVSVSARGAGVAFAGEGHAAVGGFSITADGKISLNGAKITAEKAVRIRGTEIEVLNAPARQASVESLSGAITLVAQQGSIDLRGALTGRVRDAEDPESRGAVTLSATGDIRVLTESADRLAIAFAANDDLFISAGGALTNNTGRLLSNARTIIRSASVENTVDVTGAANNGDLMVTQTKGRRFWQSLWLHRKKSFHYAQSFGSLRIADQLAYIVGNSVDIRTGSFLNRGEIDAHDGALVIRSTTLRNEGVQTGSVVWDKRCGIICTVTGNSTLSAFGGTINSARGLLLEASGSIVNDAGQIVSYGNMELNAPSVTARAAFVPTLVVRPGGLNSFFAGSQGWMALQPFGGTFIAPSGSIAVQTLAPVAIEGGAFYASAGVENPAGENVITPAAPVSPIPDHRTGLFRGLLR